MELFFHEANSEEFRNSILSIEHPTAQKVIDSEYFVQAYCLNKALKIIIEKENINILDYDKLNNFLSDFFGAENIEYLIKNGYHMCGEYMGDAPDDFRFDISCTLSDKCQKWGITIENSGEMTSGPLTSNFDISKLFSNEKKMIYDGHTARIIKYIPAYKGETFAKALESHGCIIKKRVELPSAGVKYDFVDSKGNTKHALGYEEDPSYECRISGNWDNMRDPEFAIFIVSDHEIVNDGENDYSFYEHLSYFLKYDLYGRFDYDID